MPFDIEKLERAAAAGSTVDQCVLGICYLDGIDTATNHARAHHWPTIAAASGAPRALCNLGRIYEGGPSVPRDISRAIALYEASAERGEFFPNVHLARIYATGKGVTADNGTALRWYSKAAAMASQVIDCPELQEAVAYVRANSAKRGK